MNENKMKYNDVENGHMTRRSLIGAGVVAGAATLAAGRSNAASEAAMGEMDLVDIATRCIAMGERCHAYGLDMVANGETMMAGCTRAVSVMTAVCGTVARMAALNSPHLADACRIALNTCEECRVECQKHSANHPPCKACEDACATMLEVMKNSPIMKL